MGGGSQSRARSDNEDIDQNDDISNYISNHSNNNMQNNMHRIAQPLPQAQPAGKVLVMNNDCTIHKDTIKIVQNPLNKNEYSPTFNFDAMCQVIISVFFYAQDKYDPITDITTEVTPLDPKIPPKHLKFHPGKNLKYEEKLYKMDLSNYKPETLKSTDSIMYPLIIRMEKVDSSTNPMNKETKVFYYYFVFTHDDNTYQIKISREKMEWNGESYDVNEIYGINSSEFGKSEVARMDDSEKECVVCLSDKRDTIILPCRHMCLCVNCAMSIQNQTSRKCPICRDNIESFLKLTKQASGNSIPPPNTNTNPQIKLSST